MESTASPKPDRRKSPRTTDTLPITVSIARGVTETDVARRAFELFCARDGQHGRDLDDWFRAERELTTPPAGVAAAARAAASAPDTGAKRQPRKRAPRKTASLD